MTRKPKDELQRIPGVGPSIARDLRDLGIGRIDELRDRDPQEMYEALCALRGARLDRCVLYVFRCAVYYAENSEHEPELLKWWNWTDDRRVRLREVTETDLPAFFEHQLDPEANRMAAFTSGKPTDRDAFMARWTRILGDDGITKRTVLFDGHVAGHVVKFERSGTPEVSYWIGKEYWGRGVATGALSEFLGHVSVRPLYARVARDNLASIRVLEKCGFSVTGEDRGFANARNEQVEELILELRAPGGA